MHKRNQIFIETSDGAQGLLDDRIQVTTNENRAVMIGDLEERTQRPSKTVPGRFNVVRVAMQPSGLRSL
jgi:hypothetical protein